MGPYAAEHVSWQVLWLFAPDFIFMGFMNIQSTSCESETHDLRSSFTWTRRECHVELTSRCQSTPFEIEMISQFSFKIRFSIEFPAK